MRAASGAAVRELFVGEIRAPRGPEVEEQRASSDELTLWAARAWRWQQRYPPALQ